MPAGDDQHRGSGQHGVADQRGRPGGLGVDLSKAVAIRSSSLRHGTRDPADEHEQEHEGTHRAPHRGGADQKRGRDQQLGDRECESPDAGETGRHAEALERLARTREVEELTHGSDQEDDGQQAPRGQQDGIHAANDKRSSPGRLGARGRADGASSTPAGGFIIARRCDCGSGQGHRRWRSRRSAWGCR